MRPERVALDRHLEAIGEDIILRRTVGQAPNAVSYDVTCRASIRTYRLRTEELQSGISQGDWIVIFSPTEIMETGWPGGVKRSSVASAVDPAIPTKLDQLVIHGVARTITQVDPIFVHNEWVRIECHVLG
jgi:hypothetical protein